MPMYQVTCESCGEEFSSDTDLKEHQTEEWMQSFLTMQAQQEAAANQNTFNVLALVATELKMVALSSIARLEGLSLEEAFDRYLSFIRWMNARYIGMGLSIPTDSVEIEEEEE